MDEWDGLLVFDPTPCVDPPRLKKGDHVTLLSSAGVTSLVVLDASDEGEVRAKPLA